jgi:DNA-directed RNA polymerase specialized sigma24 family protein
MVALPEGLADAGEGIEVSLETDEARRLLNHALASLATVERVAVQLFILNGMPAAEVARTVGWPDAKSVYNRVYRVLKSLRRELADRGIQPGDL